MEAIMAHDSTKSFRSETYILLVDDNLEMLDSLAETLKYFAYKVTEARTGGEALALLSDASKKFDLVLMEARLANANESFLIQETVRMDIPTILMSDSESSMASREAIQKGAYFYLEKPIAVEYAKKLWEHAMTAKFHMQNMKHKGKKLIDQAMNVNVTGESSRKRKGKASCTKRIEQLGKHFGVNAYQLGYKDQGKAPYVEQSEKIFAIDAYGIRHKDMILSLQNDCNLEEIFVMMNHESNLTYCPLQNRSVKGRKYGRMPFLGMSVKNPQPPPSQENEGTYKVSSLENNIGNDNGFNAFLEHDFANYDDLAALLENFEPFSPNVGPSNVTIPNTVEVTPNPNELINNQLPGTVDTESFPFGIDSLLFDGHGDESGF